MGAPSDQEPGFGKAVAAWGPGDGGHGLVAVGVAGGTAGGPLNAGYVGVFDPVAGTGYKVTQDSRGVPGVAEKSDDFGAAVAFTDVAGNDTIDLLVGAPGESLAKVENAGAVTVLRDLDGRGIAGASNFTQQRSFRPHTKAEDGDRFGTTIAAVDFDFERWVAVGSPTEGVKAAAEAGAVEIFRARDHELETWTNLHQDAPYVSGTSETNDHFGSSLAFSDSATRDDLWLAVGVPDEDLGSTADAGVVQLISFAELHDGLTSSESSPGVPGTVQTNDQFGRGLGFLANSYERSFLVGTSVDRNTPGGGITVIPLGDGAVRQYAPGTNGQPATGSVLFGESISGTPVSRGPVRTRQQPVSGREGGSSSVGRPRVVPRDCGRCAPPGSARRAGRPAAAYPRTPLGPQRPNARTCLTPPAAGRSQQRPGRRRPGPQRPPARAAAYGPSERGRSDRWTG